MAVHPEQLKCPSVLQTIDDINMWGLLETLRHEFSDYFFIFSTHEKSYGSLLRYKLSKWGIKAKYYDLLEEKKLMNKPVKDE